MPSRKSIFKRDHLMPNILKNWKIFLLLESFCDLIKSVLKESLFQTNNKCFNVLIVRLNRTPLDHYYMLANIFHSFGLDQFCLRSWSSQNELYYLIDPITMNDVNPSFVSNLILTPPLWELIQALITMRSYNIYTLAQRMACRRGRIVQDVGSKRFLSWIIS